MSDDGESSAGWFKFVLCAAACLGLFLRISPLEALLWGVLGVVALVILWELGRMVAEKVSDLYYWVLSGLCDFGAAFTGAEYFDVDRRKFIVTPASKVFGHPVNWILGLALGVSSDVALVCTNPVGLGNKFEALAAVGLIVWAGTQIFSFIAAWLSQFLIARLRKILLAAVSKRAAKKNH